MFISIVYVRRRLELNGNAVCGRKRIRTGIKRSEYCSAVFILVAELLLRFTSAARESVCDRPTRAVSSRLRSTRKVSLHTSSQSVFDRGSQSVFDRGTSVGFQPRHLLRFVQ